MGSFDGTSVAQAPQTAKMAAKERGGLLLIWASGVALTILLISGKIDVSPANGLVFNEMLVRLLHGQFDISPSTIGYEAFVYKGHSYAYFGIFCAFLRLPLVLIGQTGIDVTKISMIVAAAVSLAARLSAVNVALTRAAGVSGPLRLIILIAIVAGGESVQYLRPSIYQEICSWGAALASVFVLLAVTRVLDANRRAGWLYAGLALTAGLALLCRVSFGLALYAALGLMLCVEAWRVRRRLPALRAFVPCALILTLFLAAAGGVNAARWGDPLAFIPIRYQQVLTKRAPDRLRRFERYGEVNVRRIPFALQYYFAPAWMLQDRKGDMLFKQTQLDLFDCVELPPSSLLLSDAEVCLLAAAGVWALSRRRDRVPDAPLAWAAVAGLSSSAVVMLLAISLTFRYRMDFYPALDFAACIGAASLRLDRARQPTRLFLYAGAAGAAMSACGLMAYTYSPFGPALDLDMRGGWTAPLEAVAKGYNPKIGHLLPDGSRLPVDVAG